MTFEETMRMKRLAKERLAEEEPVAWRTECVCHCTHCVSLGYHVVALCGTETGNPPLKLAP